MRIDRHSRERSLNIGCHYNLQPCSNPRLEKLNKLYVRMYCRCAFSIQNRCRHPLLIKFFFGNKKILLHYIKKELLLHRNVASAAVGLISLFPFEWMAGTGTQLGHPDWCCAQTRDIVVNQLATVAVSVHLLKQPHLSVFFSLVTSSGIAVLVSICANSV